MLEIEDQMKKSIRAAILIAIEDYKKQERGKWFTLHPV
jgi:hypothetical protein